MNKKVNILLPKLFLFSNNSTYSYGINGFSVDGWDNVVFISTGLCGVTKLVQDVFPGGALGIIPVDEFPKDNPDNCS